MQFELNPFLSIVHSQFPTEAFVPLPTLRPTAAVGAIYRDDLPSLSRHALPWTRYGAFGFSPGPMTLVSIFFNENDDFNSFSQLLAGTLVAPEQKSSPGELDGGEFKPMFTGLTSTPLDLTYY